MFFIWAAQGFAQTGHKHFEDYAYASWSNHKIRLPPVQDSIRFLHIRDIEVEDGRPDTLAIGLEQHFDRTPHFLVMEKGLKESVQHYVKTYARCAADSGSVIMRISKLWLTGGTAPDKDSNKLWNTHGDTIETATHLLVRIDYLLKYDTTYYLLCRYDSTLSRYYGRKSDFSYLLVDIERTATVTNSAGGLLQRAIRGSLAKLAHYDSLLPSYLGSKRKFTRKEIEGYYQKTFQVPTMTDSQLVKGVYKSYEEFKNNNPSEKDFNIVHDSKTDCIYTRQTDGRYLLEKNNWGYSDGYSAYIQSGSNYFMLEPRGKSFYVLGSKRLTQALYRMSPHYRLPRFTTPANQKFHVELRAYVLDWDSGLLY